MNTHRLTRDVAIWVACSGGHVLLVTVVSSALNYVQLQFKMAPTEFELALVHLLNSLHALFSWPFRLLMFYDVPEAELVGAAVIHFALWGAVWLVFWRLVRRVQPRGI
jgi:hypothetical protein